MVNPDPQLAEFPYQPHFADIGAHRLAYLDEGPEEDRAAPVLVMLHGNPSWSYLFRNLVARLRGRFRCIVPDHLGCGFSDKPQTASYRLALHIDNLEALLAALGIGRCGLVVHDWGGAIGMGWAVRHPGQVAAMVVCNTAAFRSGHIPRRIALCRLPLLGPLAVRGLNAFVKAAALMAVHRRMRPEIAAGFAAPYDSWARRVAILRFVQDIPMQPAHPSWATLVAIEEALPTLADKPLLLAWGGRDFCFGRDFYEEWRRRFPHAEAHWFPEAGHYLFEDAGAEIFPLIDDFCSRKLGKQA